MYTFVVAESLKCVPNFVSYGLYLARVLCSLDFPGKNTGWGFRFLLQGDLPDPGIEPGSPSLQADVLPSEPPGKP